MHRRGLRVRLTVGTEDQRPPPLVLNEAAVELLVDVSGGSAWLGDAHQLRRRVVRWGSEAARALERERLAALEYSLTGGRLVPIDTKDRDPAGRMKADSLLNFDFEGTEKEIRIGDKCG